MSRRRKSLRGIVVSPGKAFGKVWVLDSAANNNLAEPQQGMTDSKQEQEFLQTAVAHTEQHLMETERRVQKEKGAEVAEIFAAHRMILQDPGFTGEAQRRIALHSISAKQAITQVANETIQVFRQMQDDYLKERAADIQDILNQVLQELSVLDGTVTCMPSFPPEGKYIVMAEELTPAQTVNLPTERVLGFIMHKGGKTSHAAILARTYGIPAIIVDTPDWDALTETKAAAINGDEEYVEPLSLQEYELLASQAKSKIQSEGKEPEKGFDANVVSITLAANIGRPQDLSLAKKFHAQGIGLYRTEFLFMGDRLPTEDEQVQAYREVIAACKPYVTVIRTLDIGGDKQAPALALAKEQNPFLGVRAIRLCFQKPEIFITQLRALWRAACAGPTAVMFPMIATIEELEEARSYLENAKKSVIQDGYEAGNLQVGMMIEIPAAALNAHAFAKHVDFFSIGTNDLTQYTLAIDRESSILSHLYQPYHPSVLNLVSQVALAAQKQGIWTGICGEAGGDIFLAPFFASIGIQELSMAPGQLSKIYERLAALTWSKQEQTEFVQKVLHCETAAQVKAVLTSLTC